MMPARSCVANELPPYAADPQLLRRPLLLPLLAGAIAAARLLFVTHLQQQHLSLCLGQDGP